MEEVNPLAECYFPTDCIPKCYFAFVVGAGIELFTKAAVRDG